LPVQPLVQQLVEVVLLELVGVAEFVGWVGCTAIAVGADHRIVEVVGHTAVLGNRLHLRSQQDCMPLLREELVAWKKNRLGSWTHVPGKDRRTLQMCVGFVGCSQWRLLNSRQALVAFLVRFFFLPTLLLLRLQHEKKTFLVQQQVVLLWAKLAHQLNKMCVQRPLRRQELSPGVFAVVAGRLDHKNTFDLVVDGLE
jgi:hypothetical protein